MGFTYRWLTFICTFYFLSSSMNKSNHIEFEMGDRVVSLKKIDDFEPFSYFKIKGQGDLSWNMASNKKGFGFNVVIEKSVRKNSGWTMETQNYYFTDNEMQELFILAHEYEGNKIQIERDLKIKQIIN